MRLDTDAPDSAVDEYDCHTDVPGTHVIFFVATCMPKRADKFR